jgi:hypothetical protein
MICDVCNDMLHRHEGRQWRGMFDLQFDHHADERSLKDSVDKHCGICRNIWRELLRLKPEDRSSFPGVRGEVEAQSPFISLICLSLLRLGRKEFTALTSS